MFASLFRIVSAQDVSEVVSGTSLYCKWGWHSSPNDVLPHHDPPSQYLTVSESTQDSGEGNKDGTKVFAIFD